MYAANLSTEENAAKLGIKASTIFVVMKHAKAKLGVATRSEAIRAYLAANQAGCVCTLDIPVYAHDRVGQIVGDPVVQGSGDVITLGLAALPFEASCPVGLPARVSPVRLMPPLSHCWPNSSWGKSRSASRDVSGNGRHAEVAYAAITMSDAEMRHRLSNCVDIL